MYFLPADDSKSANFKAVVAGKDLWAQAVGNGR
jgi:hypothetical protein